MKEFLAAAMIAGLMGYSVAARANEDKWMEDVQGVQAAAKEMKSRLPPRMPAPGPLPLLQYERAPVHYFFLPVEGAELSGDLSRLKDDFYPEKEFRGDKFDEGKTVRIIRFHWTAPAANPHPKAEGLLHLYEPVPGDFRNARPLILVLPITGDPKNYFSRKFCGYFFKKGYRCVFLERYLPPESELPQNMEELFELPGLPPYSTETARRGLDALEQMGVLRPGEKIGVAGISLGAIDAALLALTDERVGAAALLLGGANLPKMLSEIRGVGVGSFARSREKQMQAHNWSLQDFTQEMARHTYIGDPLVYLQKIPSAGRLAAERFLMINMDGDTAVPNACSDQLYEALKDGKTLPEYEKLFVPLPKKYRHVLGAFFRSPGARRKMKAHFEKFLSD